jgi:heme exporter protein D
MNNLDDILNKNTYRELTSDEKLALAELCSDEQSFAQLKSFMSRSKASMPVDPPANVLTTLEATFEATHKQNITYQRPSLYRMYVALAVAASLVVLFMVYWFSSTENSKKQMADVKPKKQESHTVKPKDNNAKPTAYTSEPTLIAEVKAEDHFVQNERMNIEPSMGESPVAVYKNDDAKPEAPSASSGDFSAKDEALMQHENRATQDASTYQWTTYDQKRKDDDAAAVAVTSKKPKGQNKRLNNAVLLKKIKPMY